MTPGRFEELRLILHRLEEGRNYLKVARDHGTSRSRIQTLLGNIPQLVTPETMQRCWELMAADAQSAIAKMAKEFEEA